MLIYRLLATLFAPVLGAFLLWRVLRRRESWADLAQRLGSGVGQPGALWLHGASNGELTSAKRLVEAIRAAFPNTPLLVTSNTTTARDLVQGWGMGGVTAQLAPLDLRWVLVRFRARWQPRALLVLENELWPNRIASAEAPVILIAARMSRLSAGRWHWLRFLTRDMLQGIARLYPQDTASGGRFVELGLPVDRLGPVVALKSGVSLADPSAGTLAALQKIFPRPKTILAASTHDGEEALILQAFRAAHQDNPTLRLILAPRHPRRSREVQALIAATGLPHATRSAGKTPDPDCAVYLADTLGEMPLWYALAGITVIGGGFSDRGGHTPFEPAQFNSALIHGPDTANFAEPYAALHRHEAAREVRDAEGLTRTLADLSDPDTQQAMANRAQTALAELDTSDKIIAEIITDLRRRLSS